MHRIWSRDFLSVNWVFPLEWKVRLVARVPRFLGKYKESHKKKGWYQYLQQSLNLSIKSCNLSGKGSHSESSIVGAC